MWGNIYIVNNGQADDYFNNGNGKGTHNRKYLYTGMCVMSKVHSDGMVSF